MATKLSLRWKNLVQNEEKMENIASSVCQVIQVIIFSSFIWKLVKWHKFLQKFYISCKELHVDSFISLTTVLRKILEKLIKMRLNKVA